MWSRARSRSKKICELSVFKQHVLAHSDTSFVKLLHLQLMDLKSLCICNDSLPEFNGRLCCSN